MTTQVGSDEKSFQGFARDPVEMQVECSRSLQFHAQGFLTDRERRSTLAPMKLAPVVLALGLIGACTDGMPAGSTGGTGGSTPLLGDCSRAITTAAFAACSEASPCGCPMGCVADPAFPGPVCEEPCAETCPGKVALPGTSGESLPTASACVDGYCRLDACGFAPSGAAASGSYDGLCTAVSSNDGTCFPTGLALSDGGALQWGICLKGDLDGACGPTSDPSCPPGAFCIAGGCRPACDPTVPSTCNGGAACQDFPAALNPHAGYCGPPCSQNGQACGTACCDPSSACSGQGTGTGGSNGVCRPGG
jgi:hypothetical protein